MRRSPPSNATHHRVAAVQNKRQFLRLLRISLIFSCIVARRETGGDAGRLTGLFTRAAHEGAAGTLERSDLTAVLGASR